MPAHRFSDEQVERANRANLLEYARTMGYELIPVSGIANHSVGQKMSQCYSERVPREWCLFCIALRYSVTTV
jgi:hypothetical protein